MKVLVLLAALANVVLFMWEFRQGGFELNVKISQQPLQEPMVLVSELKREIANVDFRFTRSFLHPLWIPAVSGRGCVKSS